MLIKSVDAYLRDKDEVIKLPHLDAHLRGVGGITQPLPIKLVSTTQPDETWSIGSADTSDFIYGDRSLSISSAGSQVLPICTLPDPITVRGNLGIWLKTDDWSNVDYLWIFVYSDVNNYWKFKIENYGLGSPNDTWRLCWFYRDRITQNPGGSPAPWDVDNPTYTITRVGIQFKSNDATTVVLHFGGLVCHEGKKAGIIFRFDDGYDSVYDNAFPRMKAYGYKGLVAVIPGLVGGADKMTASELDVLYNEGWDIINHTYDHNVGATEAEVRENVSRAAKWLKNRGYCRSANLLIWPGNSGGSGVLYAGDYAKDYCLMICASSHRQYGQQPNHVSISTSFPWIPPDRITVPHYGCDTVSDIFAAAGGLKDIIDEAVADHHCLMVYTHKVEEVDLGSSHIDIQFLEDMLDYVRGLELNDDIEVLTMSELYNRIYGRPGSMRLNDAGADNVIDGDANTIKIY